MNKRNISIHQRFQYYYNKKKSTIIEFDIIEEDGKNVVKNITLTSNWRVHYPKNPQITSNPQGEYGFSGDGFIMQTNGDIRQIIKKIFQIVDEVKG